MNLMLIGVEEETVAALVRTCEAVGHFCTGFTDIREALKVYGREPQVFDAIILDASQPERIGAELLQKIRGIDPGSSVFMVIDQNQVMMAVEAINAQVNAILWQPVEDGEIARVLFRRSEELDQQRKSKEEQTTLVKEYIKLKREFGEAQVLLRKYETLLSKDAGN